MQVELNNNGKVAVELSCYALECTVKEGWLKMGVKYGSTVAMTNLVDIYEAGEHNIPINGKKSHILHLSTAAKGPASARVHLVFNAKFYHGEYDTAHHLYYMAAKGGYNFALQILLEERANGRVEDSLFRDAKEEHKSYHKKMETNNNARKAAVKAFIHVMEHIKPDYDPWST